MDINQAFLTEFIDEEIYLIHKTEQTTTVAANQTEPSSTPKIHLITNEVSLSNTSSELAILLSKILAAVQLDFSKVTLSEQFDENSQGKAIIFGDITLKEKYIIEQKENLKILRADFLRSIAASPDLKKALWGALKQLF